ncbi:acyl-CoA dehydrogenase family protein [Kitasatospora saccharophila]|uniref:Acyl-CoA dehydrogenase family protein n=1 Tax=Kitasatospora saccharophila TaxID=407973 RepID=A0ABP5K3T3_9ACTN
MLYPNSTSDAAARGAGGNPAEWSRDAADRIVRPTAAERDRAGRWDPALLAELAGLLAGPLVPPALGGGGLSAAETFALLEGLGEGSQDPGFSLAVTTHAVLSTVPIRAFGTAGQRERYLPRAASGEWLGAVSLRQTQGAALAPTVLARPAGPGSRGWVLDGAADLVAGAPVAHHFLVVAAHRDGGRTAFLVDRDRAGLLVEEAGPAAMRTCPWGRLVLDGCEVPEEAVLGTPGGAADEVEPLLAALDWVFTSAPWLGLMRALTRDAVADSREQLLFGRPLVHAQSVRFTLADLVSRCELAAGLLRRAAAQFDEGSRPSRQDAAAARLFVVEAARLVTEGAAGLSGAAAFTGDHLVERAHRDALFFAGTGGGPEVLRPVIAAALLELG